jgi:hypothetical protein
MSNTDEHPTPEVDLRGPRKPYVAPQICEEAQFESLSLACLSQTLNQGGDIVCANYAS